MPITILTTDGTKCQRKDVNVSDHLTYQQVADLIEERLGQRPTTSALRHAQANNQRSRRSYSSLTAGMPPPLQTRGRRGARLFDRAAIEEWVTTHPLLTQATWQAELERTRGGEARAGLVHRARAAGLSWQAIATALGRADATTYTRQAAQQRYGRT